MTDLPSHDTLHRMPLTDLEDLYTEVASAFFLRNNRESTSAKLAAMKVGDTYLFGSWISANQLRTADKRNARRRLCDPAAQWSARTTNKGVRVTRVR